MTHTEEVLSVLSDHGFVSEADARAAMVAFGCLACGSIVGVTAATEEERVQQRDVIARDFGDGYFLTCCEGEAFRI